MNQKNVWTAVGIVGGVMAVGVSAVAVLNSRQMKLLRGAKRAEKLLYRVGSAMQSVSGLMG